MEKKEKKSEKEKMTRETGTWSSIRHTTMKVI